MPKKQPKPPAGPKYPQVRVKLSGTDGNAFALMGRATAAARRAGVSQDDIDTVMNEAMSGDYDHLLATLMANFNVL